MLTLLSHCSCCCSGTATYDTAPDDCAEIHNLQIRGKVGPPPHPHPPSHHTALGRLTQ